MNPDNISNNDQSTIKPQPLPGIEPQQLQNTPVVAESVVQPPLVNTLDSVAPQAQSESKQPRYVKTLASICLGLGIVTVIGTFLVALGLASGAFTSNQGFAMVSSLLIGSVYSMIQLYGTIFCIIALILLLIAKRKRHIAIKKFLIMAITGMIMIQIPSIILNILAITARSMS